MGHRPRLHFETTPYPLLSLDRTEKPFARGRFVIVTLAPVVLLTALLVVGVAMGPYAGWLIVPAAFHLTASKMDIAYSLVAMRQPAGTQCQIGENGLELTEPVDYEVP
jgi:Putative zincin peptidase